MRVVRQLMVRQCNVTFFSEPVTFPASAGGLPRQLSLSLRACQFSSSLYKGYSFRIGATTGGVGRGFSDARIRSMGRWNSDAFKRYIRFFFSFLAVACFSGTGSALGVGAALQAACGGLSYLSQGGLRIKCSDSLTLIANYIITINYLTNTD